MNVPMRLATIAAVLHITPAVVLVKRPDAVQALLPGADAYFAREVHLSTPDAHRLHKAVEWSPEDGVLTFYVGRTGRWPPTGRSTQGAPRAQKHETARRSARAVLRRGSQLERRIVQLVPGDREVAAAAGADHPLGMSP